MHHVTSGYCIQRLGQLIVCVCDAQHVLVVTLAAFLGFEKGSPQHVVTSLLGVLVEGVGVGVLHLPELGFG